VLKSANALWNGSFRLKKTPETKNLPVDITEKEKLCLEDDYEQLRSYALSPIKTLSHPLGLDLWCKKGFLSWINVMLKWGNREELTYKAPMQSDNHYTWDELSTSLTNMFIEWREIHGRINYYQS